MKVSVGYTTNFKQGFKDLNSFQKYIEKLEGEFSEVGYSDEELHRNNQNGEYDISMAHLATILHEGYREGGIPSRPFLRNTLQQLSSGSRNKSLAAPFEKYVTSLKNKQYSVGQLLLDIGDIIREETKKNFGIGAIEPLADNDATTIRIKGRNDPLVDAGSLRDGIEVRTSRGGGN